MKPARKTKPTPAKKQDTPLVIHDFTTVAPDRNFKDVGQLKQAITSAESIAFPNRSRLYDIYENNLSLDGFLKGLVKKRKSSVLNKKIEFFNAKGEKVQQLTQLINSKEFKKLLDVLFKSILYGTSGVEFKVGNKFDFEEIPIKHINIDKDTLLVNQWDIGSGIPIKDLPYCWVLGDKRNLGELLACSLYAIYKRGAFGDFAQYVEIFGQPVRIMQYDAYDTRTKQELRELLNRSGSSLAMMIPKQASFQMLDGKNSNGTGELHKNLIECCNQEMSIALLGNTETTSSSRGSGYAQAKVQEEQQDEITKEDIRLVESYLNDPYFICLLAGYGYPVQGGEFKIKEDLNLEYLSKRIEIDLKVAEKVAISSDYWYDTYGLPKPENKNNKPTPSAKDKQEFSDKKDAENQTKRAPEITLIQTNKTNVNRFYNLFASKKKNINLSDYYDACCPSLQADQEPPYQDYEPIYTQIARDILDKKNKGTINTDLYMKIADQLIGTLDFGKNKSFDSPDNRLRSILMRNLYHFSAAKSLAEMQVFKSKLLDPETGMPIGFSRFKQQISQLGYVFNSTYLKTEYHTAVNRALSALQWETTDSQYLQFRTVADDRVRPEHAVLDKITLPKSSPIWDTMVPPLGWNCRCIIVPASASKYDKTKEKDLHSYTKKLVENTIFDNNPGKTKVIFNQGHPYFENLPQKELRELVYHNYGLKSMNSIYVNSTFMPYQLLEDIQELPGFWNAKVNSAKGWEINNFLQEAVLFSDSDFRTFTKKASDLHKRLFPNIQDTLKSPSEIWQQKVKNKMITYFIKFFKDQALVVEVVDNQIKNLYTTLNNVYRKGLLLYRNPDKR